jgi:hypothetical protein
MASGVLVGVFVGAKVSAGVLDIKGVLVGICSAVAVQDTRDKIVSVQKQMIFFMFVSSWKWLPLCNLQTSNSTAFVTPIQPTPALSKFNANNLFKISSSDKSLGQP